MDLVLPDLWPSLWLFAELYASAVPLFAPARDLLVDWHVHEHLFQTVTWSNVTRAGEGPATQPYPNNRWSDREAQLHWSRFHLPYQLPHVQIFRSIRELLELLQSANLPSISALMQQEVASMIRQARFEWTSILNKVDTRIAHSAGSVP